MEKVLITNKKTGKKKIVTADRAAAIMSNQVLNPFGRSNLEVSSIEQPTAIAKQIAKKEVEIKEETKH